MHSQGNTGQGLFNLIAQQDQTANLEIARDSRALAEQSIRDTTSMKAIAGVTMAFLPGTFATVSISNSIILHVKSIIWSWAKIYV